MCRPELEWKKKIAWGEENGIDMYTLLYIK